MGRTRGNKDKKDVPTEPGGDSKDGDQAELETADGLDPALAKALSIMTRNIIQVIDDKLCPPTETIYKNATEIQAASKHLHEAEARQLKNSAATQEPRIVELEKKVSALTESLDMAENYSRRLNIRRWPAGGYGDWAAGGIFQIMATSHPKDDHKSRPHKAGESPPHPRTEAGSEQEPQVAAAMISRIQRHSGLWKQRAG
ncbi:hypothetical protein ABVT39_004036 [Epinephelus coioides]